MVINQMIQMFTTDDKFSYHQILLIFWYSIFCEQADETLNV